MFGKKPKDEQRKSLLASASVLAAAAAAVTATPAVAQDDEGDEPLVVVGSRLERQDFEAISPVTTVGAEQLELTATLTTDSLLNELPQIVPGNTRTSNNAGGEDFATVDLRGLGPNRTLVLINGERVPGSSTTGVVDLNTIPASLISRIEVVTGGASAVYGSDALAGVVNFVLKDDYEGAEITMTYGAELETGNAQEFEVNGLVGGNFANGRGNMTAYGSYYDRNGVLQSEYDYSRVSGAVCYDGSIGGPSSYFVCDSAAEAAAVINSGGFGVTSVGGSGTPPWGWITNNGSRTRGADGIFNTADDVVTGNPFFTPTLVANGLTAGQFASYDHDCNPATPNIAYTGAVGKGKDNIAGTADDTFTPGALSWNDAGALEPRNTAGACGVPDRAAGSSRYNYGPDNYLILPAERIALTTTGHYEFENDVRLNLLINYINSRTEVQLAPTPATGLTVTLTPNMRNLIQANSPDLWVALQSRPNPYAPFVMDRRMTEVGTRNAYNENNAFFVLTGLEGSVGDNWDWNLTASYGQVLFNIRAVNSVNKTGLAQGLAGCQSLTAGPDGVFNTLDDGGANLGASALPGCVPLDIFGPGTLDPAMQSFIRVNTFTDVTVEESRVAGFVRGDLFELPAGPVGTVFGFEYRDSFVQQTNDNEQRTGNIFGFNAIQDVQGSIDVYELYTEALVPILSEVAFAHYLGLEAGFRWSNYSSAGNVESYKVGLEWAPTDWLRFRAVQNEATRAPSAIELFQAGDQGFPGYTDPCRDVNLNGAPDGSGATSVGPAPTQAECVGQGVPIGNYPGFVANNSQVEAFAFGNPNLSTETAETLTVGFVLQPDWFPVGDFRATVDYYEIEITDVIATFGAQFWINQCYHGDSAAACARVIRDTTSGQIDFVNTTVANSGLFATSGIDVQLEWSFPIGPGELTLSELYSYLDSFVFDLEPGQPPAAGEFAGTTSAGIGGAFPDYKSVFSATYVVGDWTFFGRWTYQPELRSSNGFASAFGGAITPASSYVDVSTRWNVNDNFTLTLNVDNVADEIPPQTTDGTIAQSNTDIQIFRPLGRSFSISGRYRF
jgi:outer membrane receptor protein involved in Fe transport